MFCLKGAATRTQLVYPEEDLTCDAGKGGGDGQEEEELLTRTQTQEFLTMGPTCESCTTGVSNLTTLHCRHKQGTSRHSECSQRVDAQTLIVSTASRSVRGCPLTTQRQKCSAGGAAMLQPTRHSAPLCGPPTPSTKCAFSTQSRRPSRVAPSLFVTSTPILRLHVGLAPHSRGACTCGTSTAVVPQPLELQAFHLPRLVHLLDANHQRDCQMCPLRAHADLAHLLRLLHE